MTQKNNSLFEVLETSTGHLLCNKLKHRTLSHSPYGKCLGIPTKTIQAGIVDSWVVICCSNATNSSSLPLFAIVNACIIPVSTGEDMLLGVRRRIYFSIWLNNRSEKVSLMANVRKNWTRHPSSKQVKSLRAILYSSFSDNSKLPRPILEKDQRITETTRFRQWSKSVATSPSPLNVGFAWSEIWRCKKQHWEGERCKGIPSWGLHQSDNYVWECIVANFWIFFLWGWMIWIRQLQKRSQNKRSRTVSIATFCANWELFSL